MFKVFSTTIKPQSVQNSAEQAVAGLWRIDEIILNTTNIRELSSKIVNVMLEELGYLKLGYVMIVLSLLDEKKKYLKRISISQTKFAQEALKNSPTPFKELIFDMGIDSNLPIKSLKSKKAYITSDLSHMLYPAIGRNIVREVQEKIGVETSIVFPIFQQKEALGTIIFSLNKSESEVTDFEKQILVGFTNAAGIAIQHSYLIKKLHEANKKLKELDKRKDEFISVAAHELRAPLTAVKGYLSMVLEGDAGRVPMQINEFLKGAFEGAEREVRLVNNMLNVSRIEEGRLVYQMGKVKLGEVVKTVYDEFTLDAESKKLHFTLEVPSGLKDRVLVDQDRIHEVVANFVSNAIKYTDKGSVTVRLLNPDRSVVRIEVIDTGYGMTAEEKKKLFSKFYRTESSAGKALGSGLGLYITKLLIEKFQGKLGVESELEKGSTFWFELPLD